MSEHVLPLDLEVTWEPNVPEAVLVTGDLGSTVLALRPHPDDADRRNVVLRWVDARAAAASPPNDQAISQHRLFERGLRAVLWIGIVEESELVDSFRGMGAAVAARGLVHHVLPLKECVVEVVARNVVVYRDGAATTLASACRFAED